MYNIYQGTPMRYGGFFVANIVLWWLCSFMVLRKNKDSRLIIIGFILILFWLFVGFIPVSFELRYWLFLPIILAIVTLVFLKEYRNSDPDATLYIFVNCLQIIIFIFVLYNTHGYISPSQDYKSITSSYGYSFADYDIIVKTPTCLVGKMPDTFLYKLENPNMDIQASYRAEDCIYPPMK
jgi:hypothetical protein